MVSVSWLLDQYIHIPFKMLQSQVWSIIAEIWSQVDFLWWPLKAKKLKIYIEVIGKNPQPFNAFHPQEMKVSVTPFLCVSCWQCIAITGGMFPRLTDLSANHTHLIQRPTCCISYKSHQTDPSAHKDFYTSQRIKSRQVQSLVML